MTTSAPDYASKITALLAKAQDPAATPAEAETYSAKAEALMVKWGISDAELDAKRRGQKKSGEKIVESVTQLDGPNARGLVTLGAEVANGLGTVRLLKSGSRRSTMAQNLFWIGHESDVARAMTLFDSLTIQALQARDVWWAETKSERVGFSANDRFLARRQFLISFGQAVGARLTATRKAAEGEVAASTELVLVGRSQRVEDYVNETYSKLGKAPQMNGGRSGHVAGAAAGRKANLGGTQVGTSSVGSLLP